MEIPHSELTQHHLAGVCVHSVHSDLTDDKRRNKPMAKVNRSIKNDKEPEILQRLDPSSEMPDMCTSTFTMDHGGANDKFDTHTQQKNQDIN